VKNCVCGVALGEGRLTPAQIDLDLAASALRQESLGIEWPRWMVLRHCPPAPPNVRTVMASPPQQKLVEHDQQRHDQQ
jgi:hypothetical protein